MLEVYEQVRSTVSTAGGSMPYPDLLETLDFQQRQFLPKVLEYGKSQGTLQQTVVFDADAGASIHSVLAIGS